jgi:lipoprotein-releasing system permease protein
MKFEWFIASKYLTKGRKNSFISIISMVSILGIAIGVAALIIALALINGFQNDIRNFKFLGPHNDHRPPGRRDWGFSKTGRQG